MTDPRRPAPLASGPLGASMREAANIAAELRRDFQRAYQTQFDRAPMQDPVLMTLIHALAVQTARVYREAEDIFPWQVLDDLMNGLGMPRLTALPAQTIVAFGNLDRRECIGPDLALQGMSNSGETLTFAPDVSIELAPVKLVFSGVAENGQLATVAGATLEDGTPWSPSSVACAAARSAPALLLAFDTDGASISGLGLHVNTGGVSRIAEALQRSPWIMLGEDGASRDAGTMRARVGRGGVNLLEWFDRPRASGDEEVDGESVAAIDVGTGPFGDQLWVFPHVPAERRWRTMPPRAYAAAVESLLADGESDFLARPLVWVVVPMPAGTVDVTSSVQSIAINAVSVSNIETFTEQVTFDRVGNTVAMRPEGDANRHLLGVLSVIGESGTRYVQYADLESAQSTGRWRAREGRIELRPAKRASGRTDSFAVLRLLLCDGARANGLEPGSVTRIAGSLDNITAQVVNLTTSRGGASPPNYPVARQRFAELLRTRERVVTSADYDITARAFDPRVSTVVVDPRSEITGGALRAVDNVTVRAQRAEFADPDADAVRLRDGLERHLTKRAVLGRAVRVTVELEGR